MRRLSPDATQWQQSPASGVPLLWAQRQVAIKDTRKVDILTLKWHHGDGRTPPSLTDWPEHRGKWRELVSSSSRCVAIRRTDRPLSPFMSDRTREFIRSPPDSIRTFVRHLVTMHTGAGSPKKGPTKAWRSLSLQGVLCKRVGLKRKIWTPVTPNSPSLLNFVAVLFAPS